MPTLKHPVTGVVVDVPDDVAGFLGWPAAESAGKPTSAPEKPKPSSKASESKG